jgi:hypothetical protein
MLVHRDGQRVKFQLGPLRIWDKVVKIQELEKGNITTSILRSKIGYPLIIDGDEKILLRKIDCEYPDILAAVLNKKCLKFQEFVDITALQNDSEKPMTDAAAHNLGDFTEVDLNTASMRRPKK